MTVRALTQKEKARRLRKQRIKELENSIDSARKETYEDAAAAIESESTLTDDEIREAYEDVAINVNDATEPERNQIEFLQREELLEQIRENAIKVPDEFWVSPQPPCRLLRVLTSDGGIWAR